MVVVQTRISSFNFNI